MGQPALKIAPEVVIFTVVKNVTCTERLARFVVDTGLAQHTVFPFKRSALHHTFFLLHTNCFTRLAEYTSVQI